MGNTIPTPDYSKVSLDRQEAEAHLLNTIYDHRDELSAEAWAINQRLIIPGRVGSTALGMASSYSGPSPSPHLDTQSKLQ